MQLKALKEFSYSTDGSRLVQYEAGQIIETEDEGLVSVSISEGWAEYAPVAVNPENPQKTIRRKAAKNPS